MYADVAVVGGGPAGCSAALALRAKGYTVAVISAPGRHEKPTETAVPALSQLLHSLGVPEALDACEPCWGIHSHWGKSVAAFQPSIINPSGHAWFIHRTGFDRCLQLAAQRTGTLWVEGIAESVDFDESGVSVLTKTTSLRARWLVAATGSPAWPARITQQKTLVIDSLVAFWARLSPTLNERLLFVETADDGWWYACPADDKETMVCFVTDALNAHALGVSRADVFNQLFRATALFERFPSAPSAELVHAITTGIAILPRIQNDRWIAVGDAAVKIDPLASSGTATALDSGRRAALAIDDALQGNPAEIDRYSRWSTGLAREFIRQRGSHYAMENSRRVSGFWQRRTAPATQVSSTSP